jgi:hypothetical protein|tara:strand:- start:413 stop:889 length:477 start_codon:yes stop_codon:yes gene_type:complete
MKFNKIKSLIGGLVPTIAAGMGSPVAGMAVNMVADALGCKPEPRSIEQALGDATPEQLIRLKAAEQEFEVQMKQMDIDVFALETQDIQDARSKFGNDWTPKVLGLLSMMGFMSYIFFITAFPIDDSSDDIVMLIIGSLTGIATAVISFYFGSSNKKDK